MPTYQYVCTACDRPLEAVQSFSDDPLTECPECQGRLRKVFGSVGVVFKGSGFYRTDSRSGSSTSSSSSSSSPAAPSESGTSSASSGSSESTGATSAAGHSITPAAATT